MGCQYSDDRKLVVCGGGHTRQHYFFTKDRRYVLKCNSLWYEPTTVMKRKKFARIDLFEAQVKRKLGFLPMTYRGWWRTFAVPELREITGKKETA